MMRSLLFYVSLFTQIARDKPGGYYSCEANA
jgi:hypothetical protein